MGLRQYPLSAVLFVVALIVIHVACYVFPTQVLARHLFLFAYLGYVAYEYRRIPLIKQRRATDRGHKAAVGGVRQGYAAGNRRHN